MSFHELTRPSFGGRAASYRRIAPHEDLVSIINNGDAGVGYHLLPGTHTVSSSIDPPDNVEIVGMHANPWNITITRDGAFPIIDKTVGTGPVYIGTLTITDGGFAENLIRISGRRNPTLIMGSCTLRASNCTGFSAIDIQGPACSGIYLSGGAILPQSVSGPGADYAMSIGRGSTDGRFDKIGCRDITFGGGQLGGVIMGGGDTARMQQVTFIDCSFGGGGAAPASQTEQGCLIIHASGVNPGPPDSSKDIIITDCHFQASYNCRAGIFLQSDQAGGIEECIISDNYFRLGEFGAATETRSAIYCSGVYRTSINGNIVRARDSTDICFQLAASSGVLTGNIANTITGGGTGFDDNPPWASINNLNEIA